VAVNEMNLKKDRRTYRDRRKYLIDAVQKRRIKVRKMAIEYKGGKCSNCGYNTCYEALEFHHLNADGKDFGISDKGYTRSWAKIKKELDKCVLLCSNCHREVHAGLQLSREIGIEKSGEFREA
jgi:5-methylcytosine-specific restriction endonuclease McrA